MNDPIIKICEVCKNPFEIPHRKRSIADKRRFCSKKCSNNSPDVIEKIKCNQLKTFQEKYGSHPMQTDKTIESFRNSMIKKYGVDHPSKLPDFKDKVKKTKLNRYGDENYNNIEKTKQTCLEKYGVDNIRKSQEVIDSINKTILTNHYNYIGELCKTKKLIPLFNRDQYVGYHFSNLYKFQCLICGNQFEDSVYKPQSIICNKCNPDKRLTLEYSFFDFLSSIIPNNIEIKRRDRTILNGKELDFYIPFKKIAFEINGLYWHSEFASNTKKHYHLNKTKNCLFHGVRLIHVFENEWNEKREIVESILKFILGYRPEKVNGRDCIVKEISIKEKNQFLNQNHLQGEDKSTIKLGLYYCDLLVSVMTFRKTSRFDKNVEWELSRFCNKLNTNIVGGASKLFSYFTKNYQPKSIVSYSDRRYFDGNVYLKLGFKFVHNTPPNYYYIIDKYKGIKNRLSFQKHKLKKILPNFDPSLTEWENMKNNGFDRIWDCGNSKWIYES